MRGHLHPLVHTRAGGGPDTVRRQTGARPRRIPPHSARGGADGDRPPRTLPVFGAGIRRPSQMADRGPSRDRHQKEGRQAPAHRLRGLQPSRVPGEGSAILQGGGGRHPSASRGQRRPRRARAAGQRAHRHPRVVRSPCDESVSRGLRRLSTHLAPLAGGGRHPGPLLPQCGRRRHGGLLRAVRAQAGHGRFPDGIRPLLLA